jgi:hypothetical protein
MSEKKRGGGRLVQRPQKSRKSVKTAGSRGGLSSAKGQAGSSPAQAPGPAGRPSPQVVSPETQAVPSKDAAAQCLEPGCQALPTTRGYCRLHYIKNWKVLKSREQRAARRHRSEFDDGLLHRVPLDYEDRGDRVRPAPRRSLDLEISRAREDVEEMFREMGFEDEF